MTVWSFQISIEQEKLSDQIRRKFKKVKLLLKEKKSLKEATVFMDTYILS